MWYSTGCGLINLKLTKAQAISAGHAGQCDEDVETLSEVPGVARQLKRIDPELLRRELREYGAWDETELADHAQNLQRLLWIAAVDITDQL